MPEYPPRPVSEHQDGVLLRPERSGQACQLVARPVVVRRVRFQRITQSTSRRAIDCYQQANDHDIAGTLSVLA
jgi:hypothetical protein